MDKETKTKILQVMAIGGLGYWLGRKRPRSRYSRALTLGETISDTMNEIVRRKLNVLFLGREELRERPTAHKYRPLERNGNDNEL